MSEKKLKNISVFLICLACSISAFLTLNSSNKMVIVNFSDTIITENIDKEQSTQLALLKRLEQQVNQMNGVKSSKITQSNEGNILDVTIILSADATPTDDLENSIINLLKRSSAYNEFAISWSQ
mgnify:CR=1 FL=1